MEGGKLLEDKVFENKKQGIALNSVFEKTKKNITDTLYKLIVFGIIIAIWHVGAKSIGSSLLLPMPIEVAKGFIQCITDPEIVKNVMITMSRVLKGFTYAMAIGLPLGIIMGFSKTVEKAISPVVDSARQIPIMSWVPLTIVWFGIGDGPTVFLIGFSSIFPIILNTIQGIRSISKDYYNAARSMGASPLTIFTNVMLPAALPDILTGARIGIGIGWMSVI